MTNPTDNQTPQPIDELDEILDNLGERYIMVEHRLIHQGMPEENGKHKELERAKARLLQWGTRQRIDEGKKHWMATMGLNYSEWSAKRNAELQASLKDGGTK